MQKNHAEYIKELRHNKDQQLKNFKTKRFEALVRYAEPLKGVLAQYRPENQSGKKEEKPEVKREQLQGPPQQRKKWILGWD